MLLNSRKLPSVIITPYSWEIGFDRKGKALCLFGVALTEVSNYISVRAYSIGLHWPPFNRVACFKRREEL